MSPAVSSHPIGSTTLGGGISASVPVGTSTGEIISMTPGHGNPGETLVVTLAGFETGWIQDHTSADFGSEIAVNKVTIDSPTSARVSITISPTGTLGNRVVVMTTV